MDICSESNKGNLIIVTLHWFAGKWPKHLWDDSEDSDSTETIDLQNRGSRGERATDPRERETLSRTEAHLGTTAWPRGCRTAYDLPADAQGKNETNEGNAVLYFFLFF